MFRVSDVRANRDLCLAEQRSRWHRLQPNVTDKATMYDSSRCTRVCNVEASNRCKWLPGDRHFCALVLQSRSIADFFRGSVSCWLWLGTMERCRECRSGLRLSEAIPACNSALHMHVDGLWACVHLLNDEVVLKMENAQINWWDLKCPDLSASVKTCLFRHSPPTSIPRFCYLHDASHRI